MAVIRKKEKTEKSKKTKIGKKEMAQKSKAETGKTEMAGISKQTVEDINVNAKRVIVRVDFNVPLGASHQIMDDSRIRAALPTINYLIEHDAKVILMSHLGRPKGVVKQEFSLEPVAVHLSNLLGKAVFFSRDCVGEEPKKLIANMKKGDVLLLENLRFYSMEEKNDTIFAGQLASLADIYVNDAFGTAHRAHASTEGIAHLLPAVSGYLLEKELKGIGIALQNPDHPYVAIIGGAKVSDKIGVIENLLKIADKLLIGGGMANTFLSARGYDMQKSLVEAERLEWAKEMLSWDIAKDKLLLPIDLIVAPDMDSPDAAKIVKPEAVPEDYAAFDIGPETIEAFSREVKKAKTIVWNGPMGVFEKKGFEKGTMDIAHSIAYTDGFSIVGGGDSVAAINLARLSTKIDHTSTGGGASLDFLAGKKLPGVEALLNK